MKHIKPGPGARLFNSSVDVSNYTAHNSAYCG
jgi:hypothetical protein